MFRMWGRLFKQNKVIKNATIEDNNNDTRTHKVMNALDKICQDFDIAHPIWLDKNVRDFRSFSTVRFDQDSFIDSVDFDYLEIRMIEED